MKYRTAWLTLLLALATLPAAPALHAQTRYTWNGGTGSWDEPTNWTPNGIPAEADTAVVNTGEPIVSTSRTVGAVTLNDGQLAGDGILTVADAFTWTGGTLNGRGYADTAAVAIPAGATMYVRGDAVHTLRGRDILNDGTIIWEDDGILQVAWVQTLENRVGATFDIRGDGEINRANGTLDLINEGLLVKAAGTGTTLINYPFGSFVNDGTVRVESGTFRLNNGTSVFSSSGGGAFEILSGATLHISQAEYNFGEGSSVSGAGTLRVSGGAIQFSAADVVGETVITGGALRFSGDAATTNLADVALSGGELGGSGGKTVNGLLTWTGGRLGTPFDSDGVIQLLGGVSAEGEGTKFFGGGTYSNAGTFTWTGAGEIEIGTGGEAFNNLEGATFSIETDANASRSNGTLPFNNEGLVVKLEGTGQTLWNTWGAFNNRGVVEVQPSASLYLYNGGMNEGGHFEVAEGARLAFWRDFRGTLTFDAATVLSGNGTVEVRSDMSLQNHGMWTPGASPGTLTYTSSVFEPEEDAVLEIELGGLTPGVEHDVLAVTGAAALAGTLAVSVPAGYIPDVGDQFTVLTCAGGCSGSFDAVEAPSGYAFSVQYGPNSVMLEADSVIPVELTGFEAALDGDAVVLTWRTASETNNAGFAVEREGAKAWKEITFVEGAGTTTEAQAYRFVDERLPFEVQQFVYRLKQVDLDGTATYSQEVEVEMGTPEQFALHSNFPNPFVGETTIRYELPRPATVRLAVYDALGRRVRTLADERQEAGRKEVRFDAAHLAAGLYFYRLQIGDFSETRKMVLLR